MSVHEVPKIPALSILCLTYPALAGAGLLQASPNAISPSWLASLAHRNFAQCNLRHPVSSPIGGSVSPDVVSKWRLQPLRIISFSCSSSPTPPFCRFGEIQKLRSRLYHPCSSPRACQKSPETFDHDNLRHQHQQHRPFGFPVAISTTKPSSNLFMAQFALRQRRSDSQQFRWFSQSPYSALHLRLSESHRFRQQGLCHHKHSLKFVS